MPQRVASVGCASLSENWKIEPALAKALQDLDSWAKQSWEETTGLPWVGLWIISGFRNRFHQDTLNPDSPNSLHTFCPARAADLRVGNLAANVTTDATWSWLGARWIMMGWRWGGTFKDPDENHFDLGAFFAF